MNNRRLAVRVVVAVLLSTACLWAQSSGGHRGGTGGGHTIVDEVTSLPAETKLTFLGAGVTCVDNAGGGSTDCTIPDNTVSGVAFTWTSPAAGDVVQLTGAATGANATPGLPLSRTDATGAVTLNCSTANDRNKVVALSNAGAIALTGFTPGVNCPDGATIFVDVQGAAAVATLTPAAGNCNGAATCVMAQGFWRVRSDGSQTFASVSKRLATLVAADIPATPNTAGGDASLSGPRAYYFCTGTCSVTLPTPVAGYEFCVRNANNISTVITLANLTSILFELPARTGYTVSGKGLHAGGVVTDQVCVVGVDATHYAVMSSTGTWVTN